MSPIVSFLTVIFNEPLSLIERCFQSLLAQTFDDFNIVVVLNDPTRIDVLNLIQSLNSNHFKVLVMKENIGLTKALNVGLSNINSEFIARIDPDDYCMPERLQMQLDFMRKNPDYVVVGSAYDEIFESKIIPADVPLICPNDKIKEALKCFNPFAHSSLFIKTKDLKEVDGYNINITYAQDFDLICRLAEKGKMCNLKEKLVVREKSLNQVSVKKRREQLYFSIMIRSNFMMKSGANWKSLFGIIKSFISFLLPNFIYARIKN